MGSIGTNPFSSDSAIDFLGELADMPADHRRQALERTFSHVPDHLALLPHGLAPDDPLIASAAVVAAFLPGGENIRQELSDVVYDISKLAVPAPDHELATLALQALLSAAGPDSRWSHGSVTQQTAADTRQIIDMLTEILARE